ncbi:hypothetical protein A0J48_015160 [Sphaerospermopsis aphanizomenoides BCCUSP55]|uniref:hypothetical protein n=1 Tax=Sphaerospermopsis aphanizomenoides TaxID=459663 RepID=UPI0019067985|nr:hypothetical protein [Sphaerospermopsis aphanizomenoides]MBK1988860.1 hypothetical protein [Sphaerospermopsis aphanizomenoides BCCUSP55]
MKELTWQDVLQAQQQDFIQRLKYSLNKPEYDNLTLSCFDYHPVYCEKSYPSERIIISRFLEQEIDKFCCELLKKYNQGFTVDDYMNHKIGKIGEEAVNIYLDKLITGVDYKIHSGGDGGIDFMLKNNKNIGIQVKTKSLNRITSINPIIENHLDYINMDLYETQIDRFDEIKWTIKQDEIKKNKVLVCVLLMNHIVVDNIQGSYDCIITGFKPTAEIKDSGDLKMQDLLYSGGMRPFLESFS